MRFWKATIRGGGHTLIDYPNVPGSSEQEAKETALGYAPDDVPWTTWEHYQGRITVDVKFKEDR